MILIFTHAAFSSEGKDVSGPAHAIFRYFKESKYDVVFVRFPIANVGNTLVTIRINGLETSQFLKNRIMPQYLFEFLFTVKYLLSYRNLNPVYIGVDPLNGLWGVIAKKFSLISCFVYFSPDYSEIRFKNSLINKIYHSIDRLCVKYADFLWSVSLRIVKIRSRQTNNINNFLLPNAPFLKDINIKKLNKIKKIYDLILVTNLSQGVDIETLIKVIESLRMKGKSITLRIVAVGAGLDQLREIIFSKKLTSQVLLSGGIDREKLYKEIAKSKIGIALYTDKESWTKYCDPMKIRDYLAVGIPVITTNIPAISEDIRKFDLGVVIDKISVKKIESKIVEIMDKSTYRIISKNCLKYSQMYDQEKILHSLVYKIKCKA